MSKMGFTIIFTIVIIIALTFFSYNNQNSKQEPPKDEKKDFHEKRKCKKQIKFPAYNEYPLLGLHNTNEGFLKGLDSYKMSNPDIDLDILKVFYYTVMIYINISNDDLRNYIIIDKEKDNGEVIANKDIVSLFSELMEESKSGEFSKELSKYHDRIKNSTNIFPVVKNGDKLIYKVSEKEAKLILYNDHFVKSVFDKVKCLYSNEVTYLMESKMLCLNETELVSPLNYIFGRMFKAVLN